MSGGIYLLQPNDELLEMSEQPYDSEDLLQTLLARYPNLLAGNQMDETNPRRWLLIKREIAIANDPNAGGRWSLDHLFLDQDGVPTLVEVKRSSDTRLRREVVGQMLDYAANAVVYWSLERIQAEHEARCTASGTTAEADLREFLGPDTEPSQFWEHVKTNLQAERVRMVFVADEIPSELRRIVEFLNNQMDPGEVLAVEIKQFVGKNMRTLVPKVYGQTAASQRRRVQSREGLRKWDEESFLKDLASRCPQETVQVAKALLDWAKSHTTRVWWGNSKTYGGFVPVLEFGGNKHQLFEVWSSGNFETFFQWYAYKPPFENAEKRMELLSRFNEIEGVRLPPESINRRPNIPLSVFHKEHALAKLLETLGWIISEVKM
jgi:hypothetical protein